MTAEEIVVWNEALSEALMVVQQEHGSRNAFQDGSAEGWDLACEWIETRIESLKRGT
jgi:hypothetical protein